MKWIGYSDNFEKIYDDPDFSTIKKEKARERQALKDLENAGNPEIARQLEAKRKAEEEALHRTRTSSAALARAAKAALGPGSRKDGRDGGPEAGS